MLPIIVFLTYITGYVYQDSDSLLVSGNDSMLICGIHHYNLKVHLDNGGKLKIRPGTAVTADTFGRLMLHARTIHIHGSSAISGTGCGFPGGTNSYSNGWGPGAGQSGTNGGGGGAGYGGAGGDGGDSNPGSGGIAYGDPADTIAERGSGGGAGRLSQVDGWGGYGGALVYLKARKIIIDSAAIEAGGATAVDASMEAGGGGSGGGIMLRADTLTVCSSVLNAGGGSGGNATFGGGGGAGGGRIKLFYSAVLDTTSNGMTVGAGYGGTGGYGNGENGSPGSIHIGTVVGIEDEESRKSLVRNERIIRVKAFPNPSSGLIFLEAPVQAQHQDIDYRVLNAAGRVMLTGSLSGAGGGIIDLTGHKTGVYFIQLGTLEARTVVLIR